MATTTPAPPATLSVDEWVDKMQGGMTDARLHEVFDLVKPEGNWKLPICAVLRRADATDHELETAVVFFTGGHATVEHIDTSRSDGVAKVLVSGAGYYAECGA